MVVVIFWFFVYFMVIKFNLLLGSDISEIVVVFNNISLIIFYVLVFSFYFKKDIKNKFIGLVLLILVILGGLIFFIGSLLSNFFMVLIF